ncbi:MAG: hypothetical protein NT068_00830 [Candidatus Nomurabacteria bacterium]|nr:hypothetical protein [Candidatus Nomurabacteria bacterium]
MNTSILLEEAIEIAIFAFIFWIVLRILKKQQIRTQAQKQEQEKLQKEKEEKIQQENEYKKILKTFPNEFRLDPTWKIQVWKEPYRYDEFREKSIKKESHCFVLRNDDNYRTFLNCIFTTAVSEVFIFEISKTNSFFVDQAILALNSFLDRGGKVHVLLSEYHDENNLSQFMSFLKNKIFYGNKNIFITIMNQVTKLDYKQDLEFFVVADNRMYLCNHNENKDFKIGNFNHLKSFEILSSLFKKCSKNSIDFYFENRNYKNSSIEELEICIKQKLEEENYEAAAKIRDEIYSRQQPPH